MNTAKKVQAARTALVLDQPFFGALALRLAIRPDPGCGTAWVDGRSLGYDPEFIETLTHAETVALLAHEVMHCACGHPWRRDNRDPKKWNTAADYAVNPVLTDSGFTIPAGGLDSPEYAGKSAEWIFDRLPDADPDPGGQDDGPGTPGADPGDPDGPGPCDNPLGEVRDAPTGEEAVEAEATEADWKRATQEAARAAEARGQLPGSEKRFAAGQARPRVDWRAALRRFVQDVSRSDYTWTRPNPRYAASGLYLPALHSEEMGPLAVAVDTSGSIDNVLVAQFGAELNAISEDMKPARVHVIYCDSRVQRVDTFERGEPITMNPAGGGGTDFRPVFEAVEAMEEPPACIVYLTDLAGRFPDVEPAFPTLWAATRRGVVPFGDCVSID